MLGGMMKSVDVDSRHPGHSCTRRKSMAVDTLPTAVIKSDLNPRSSMAPKLTTLDGKDKIPYKHDETRKQHSSMPPSQSKLK